MGAVFTPCPFANSGRNKVPIKMIDCILVRINVSPISHVGW
jgi:hypothetical protein